VLVLTDWVEVVVVVQLPLMQVEEEVVSSLSVIKQMVQMEYLLHQLVELLRHQVIIQYTALQQVELLIVF